jgi:VWFA-related protein
MQTKAISRFLPVIFISLLVLPLLHAQGAQTGPLTFKVQSKLVLLPVTVRDSKGQLMQSITKDDLELYEDGRLQTIRYFDLEKDRPLTLGLLVDMSGSVRDFVEKESEASKVFFNAMLQKDEDTAFLVRFDDAVTIMQPATNSRDALRGAVDRLEVPHLPQSVFPHTPGSIGTGRPVGTLLYDAIVEVCLRVTKPVPGLKALVILTDGEDNGSETSLAEAITAAQEADTVIYTILYTDSTNSRGERVLDLLSKTTGGREYQVSRSQPLEAIYAKIAEEMRMQYTLGYIPVNSGAKEGYRTVQIKTKIKGLRIQTKFGYYAKE